MTEQQQSEQEIARAEIKTRPALSFVWIVPLVALIIGGWLAYKAISEKGPTITITFHTAEDLEAGKTKIKYKDVDIGQVEKITLSEDISKVVVTAKLVKGAETYLTDKTQFWVVRARVQGGSVTGLGTLLSGAYIGVNPSKEGMPTLAYTGLEVPPVVTVGLPGRHFMLKADTLGSLDIGAPVYYRQIEVGQVVSYGYGEDGQDVNIRVFINAPYDKQVTRNTRFWNASGIDVTLNAEGLKINTESMVAVATGGIAFDLPKDVVRGEEAADGAVFRLYADKASIQEKTYTIRNQWLLVFEQSVRGLNVGAPVEFYGIKVGEVIDLNLDFDAETERFFVPVIIAVEPERIRVVNKKEIQTDEQEYREGLLRQLVEQQGLRAQLRSANLLTGALAVNLAFFPDSPKSSLVYRDNIPMVPTIPGSFDRLQESMVKIIGNLEKVPFDKIGSDISLLMEDLRSVMGQAGGLIGKIDDSVLPLLDEAQKTLTDFHGLIGALDAETLPQAEATFVELQNTLTELQQSIGVESPLQYQARKTLKELVLTLRAVTDLMNTLEDRPESVIFGKGKSSHE